MKTYLGRVENGERIVVVKDGGKERKLRHVKHHSPSGFNWGYSGSGPADLALSILADYFGEYPTKSDIYWGKGQAIKYHQKFKFAFVSRFGDTWSLTEDEIRSWLEEQE